MQPNLPPAISNLCKLNRFGAIISLCALENANDNSAGVLDAQGRAEEENEYIENNGETRKARRRGGVYHSRRGV